VESRGNYLRRERRLGEGKMEMVKEVGSEYLNTLYACIKMSQQNLLFCIINIHLKRTKSSGASGKAMSFDVSS
jgi:hypothetical protein